MDFQKGWMAAVIHLFWWRVEQQRVGDNVQCDTSKALLQLGRHMQGISHCILVQQNPFSSLNSILLSLWWPARHSPHVPCVFLHPLHLIERFGLWWSCPAVRQTPVLWITAPVRGWKSSNRILKEQEGGEAMAGLFSRVACCHQKEFWKMILFPFPYARACSHPTVSCFKEPTLLPALHNK